MPRLVFSLAALALLTACSGDADTPAESRAQDGDDRTAMAVKLLTDNKAEFGNTVVSADLVEQTDGTFKGRTTIRGADGASQEFECTVALPEEVAGASAVGSSICTQG